MAVQTNAEPLSKTRRNGKTKKGSTERVTQQPALRKRRQRFEPIWDWDLINEPDMTWLVDRMIEEGCFGVLYGDTGLGKSGIAIDLAYRVALGLPWNSHSVKRGPVIYVLGEGSIGGFKKRAKAWKIANGVKDDPAHVAMLPHRVELHPKSEDLESLVKLASEIQPVLVIFDTLARCFKGNENETADMNQHIAAIDAIREEAGAATLSLHHTPKKNLTIMRGAESLRDRADVILKVVRTGKKGPVELSIEKEREEATGETYRVNRTYVPLVNSYAVEFVAKAREENDEAATLTANQQKALEALGKSPKTSSDWKRAAGLKKQSFYDAKSGLLESGHVVKNGRFYAVQLPQSPESERVRTRVH